MVAPRELGFQVIEQLRFTNAPASDEVLFGVSKRHLPADEMLPREMHAEAMRRAARAQAPGRPRSIGFRAWLHR